MSKRLRRFGHFHGDFSKRGFIADFRLQISDCRFHQDAMLRNLQSEICDLKSYQQAAASAAGADFDRATSSGLRKTNRWLRPSWKRFHFSRAKPAPPKISGVCLGLKP